MQSTQSLSIKQIRPSRGVLLCESEPQTYETASGLVAVKSIKKNPKLDKALVVAIGGPFWKHGREKCGSCHPVCTKKTEQGKYWAKPGDTIWMKRGFKKAEFIEGKFLFVPNEDVIAVNQSEGYFDSPRLECERNFWC